MPSIPQSLLWISLVVLWLFVLVPMLISKRDAVRRTSDVALATRVLNGDKSRLLRRTRPATGHASDPHWRPSEEDVDDDFDEDDDADDTPTERSIVLAAAVVEEPESDYLDVDVVDEDSGALPVGASAMIGQTDELPLEFGEPITAAPIAVAPLVEVPVVEVPEELAELKADELEDAEQAGQLEAEADDASEGYDDEYEYVADSSGLEAPSDDEPQLAESLSAARRRRQDSTTAAAVSVRKYKFRRRMLTGLVASVVASGVAAFVLSPTLWWACGTIGVVALLYLGYLRRQTRIEERLRRRRAQRMARSRLGVENTDDHEFDVVPARLRRPGSVVLEIDDEDPIFEHLDYAPFARQYDLPHAAGQ